MRLENPEKMSRELLFLHGHHYQISRKPVQVLRSCNFDGTSSFQSRLTMDRPERPMGRSSSLQLEMLPHLRPKNSSDRKSASLTIAAAAAGGGGVPLPPLDLTEENITQVLADARVEARIFLRLKPCIYIYYFIPCSHA